VTAIYRRSWTRARSVARCRSGRSGSWSETASDRPPSVPARSRGCRTDDRRCRERPTAAVPARRHRHCRRACSNTAAYRSPGLGDVCTGSLHARDNTTTAATTGFTSVLADCSTEQLTTNFGGPHCETYIVLVLDVLYTTVQELRYCGFEGSTIRESGASIPPNGNDANFPHPIPFPFPPFPSLPSHPLPPSLGV